MKFATTTAIAAALAVGCAGLAASPALAKKKEEAAAAGPKFSTEFRQAAQPLQKAIQGADYPTAQTALPAAQAAASTPDDKFNLGVMMFQLGQHLQNEQMTAQGADMAIASGVAPPDVLGQLTNFKGVTAYNKGDLAGADAAFTAIYQANPGDADNAILLAQTKVREKQPAAALPIVDRAIEAKKAAGQLAPEDWLRRALAIAYDGKMPAETIKYGQALVTGYPNTETWRVALQTFRDTTKLDPVANIDTLRLMRAANALAGERDYYEYANAVNDKGNPGEAKAVIDEGMASNMVDASVKNSKPLAELRNIAGPKIAADKASLPALEKTARAAADGRKALITGDVYLGYAMYPQATELYKLALQKGGTDPNVVNLHLGEALARTPDKSAALAAFAAVGGAYKPVADYWTIWTNQGARPAGPPAAPAAKAN